MRKTKDKIFIIIGWIAIISVPLNMILSLLNKNIMAFLGWLTASILLFTIIYGDK